MKARQILSAVLFICSIVAFSSCTDESVSPSTGRESSVTTSNDTVIGDSIHDKNLAPNGIKHESIQE